MSIPIEIFHAPIVSDAPSEYLEALCGLCFNAWDPPYGMAVAICSTLTGEVIKEIYDDDPNYYIVDHKDVIAALEARDADIARWWKERPGNFRVFCFERRICKRL